MMLRGFALMGMYAEESQSHLHSQGNSQFFYLLLVGKVLDCKSALDNKQEDYDIEDDEHIYDQVYHKDYCDRT